MLYDLNITDTEYAQLAAQGYDSNLELQLIKLGETQEEARTLTRIVGLTKDKPPETDQEWEEFTMQGIPSVADSEPSPFSWYESGI